MKEKTKQETKQKMEVDYKKVLKDKEINLLIEKGNRKLHSSPIFSRMGNYRMA